MIFIVTVSNKSFHFEQSGLASSLVFDAKIVSCLK